MVKSDPDISHIGIYHRNSTGCYPRNPFGKKVFFYVYTTCTIFLPFTFRQPLKSLTCYFYEKCEEENLKGIDTMEKSFDAMPYYGPGLGLTNTILDRSAPLQKL